MIWQQAVHAQQGGQHNRRLVQSHAEHHSVHLAFTAARISNQLAQVYAVSANKQMPGALLRSTPASITQRTCKFGCCPCNSGGDCCLFARHIPC